MLAAPGEITVVAIGPLTNVAAAIEADPGFAGALDRLVVMGGTVEVPGNITPAAEFNIWMDPESAGIVFDSGVPITMVGLDVCHADPFRSGPGPTPATVRHRVGPARGGHASESWITVKAGLFDGDEDLHLYDTLAMATAIEPDLVETRPALVEIETSTGPAAGMTVVHLNDAMRRLLTGRETNRGWRSRWTCRRFAQRFGERVTSLLDGS